MWGRFRRDFESVPGSIPVGAIAETRTAWRVLAAVAASCFIFASNGARHLVGISVGIGSHQP
jgi:hypothetical protein